MKASKTQRGLGRKLVAGIAATALACSMFALPAFAAAPNVPGVDGETESTVDVSDSSATANINTNVYLRNSDTTTNNTITVTAPTKIYLAYDYANPASGTAGTNAAYDFAVPSSDSVRLRNMTSGYAVKIDSWTVDSSSSVAVPIASGTTFANADEFYLNATPTNGAAAQCISVASTSSYTDTWVMAEAGTTNATINLQLAGQIYNPTNTNYRGDGQIEQVVWKFARNS